MNVPRTRLLAAAACLVVAAPVATAATAATASAGPIAHTATATCPGANSPTYNSAGYGTQGGYFNRLVVTGLSCASGKKLMHAHHKCRFHNGGVKGRCAHVNGYSCTEKRTTSRIEINSRVTCKNGNRKVVYYYTQNI